MNPAGELIGQCFVNKPVALNAAKAAKLFRHDEDPKVAFAGAR